MDRFEDVCKGRFDHIDGKLDRIDLAIRGNGVSPGINTRLDRLEQAAGLRGKLFLIAIGATPPIALLVATKILEKVI